jgi:hypothetical protein
MERRIEALNRFTVGWTAYVALAAASSPLQGLDEWLRRRLRQVRWKEWGRYQTRWRKLRALGIPDRKAREWAGTGKGSWRVAGSWILSRALPTPPGPSSACRASAALIAASGMHCEPPDADPHVRWRGRGRDKPGPYPISDWRGRAILYVLLCPPLK